MDYYMYQAALYCESCGESIRASLDAEGKRPIDSRNEYTYDSDDYPKGPYDSDGGVSDSPDHCDSCGVFLENPLTDDGRKYVIERIRRHIVSGDGTREVIKEWSEWYCITLNEVIGE